MSVNRLEPDLLTLHNSEGSKTLEIGVKDQTLFFRVTNEIGLGTATEIAKITPDQAETIAAALSHWAQHGRLNYQDQEPDSPLHTLKEPIRAFLIPGTRPELKGLEVAFDSEGYVGLRCASDHSKGFHLTPEASLTLSELITREQRAEQLREYFALASETGI